jgi:hypothetical protein
MKPPARCRYCRQEILWLKMQETGRLHPVDVVPSVRGSIAIVGGYRALVVRATDRPRAIAAGRRLYMSHMASCPVPRQKPSGHPEGRAYLLAVMNAIGNPNVPMPKPPEPHLRRAQQRPLFAPTLPSNVVSFRRRKP